MDFSSAAAEIAMLYRERRDQIDQMQRNPRFPHEEITKRRMRLPMHAKAVHILRAVAEDPAAQERIAEVLKSRGTSG